MSDVQALKVEIQRLQASKLELIRATSTEIERLRRIICIITGTDKLSSLDALKYEPLSQADVAKLNIDGHNITTSAPMLNILPTKKSSNKDLLLHEEDLQDPTLHGTYDPSSPTNNNNKKSIQEQNNDKNDNKSNNLENNTKHIKNEKEQQSTSSLSPLPAMADENEDDTKQYGDDDEEKDNYRNNNNNNNNNKYSNTNNLNVNNNNKKKIASTLGSIPEDNGVVHDGKIDKHLEPNLNEYMDLSHHSRQKSETVFRLSSQRMSQTGFEFSELGFMTTDFDQLSRGHTTFVNQVIHHPTQNGITVSASDDWSIMFWRFHRASGKEELQLEKNDKNNNNDNNKNKNVFITDDNDNNNDNNNNDAINESGLFDVGSRKNLRVGEISLYPVLKINTGLEVKAIQLSRDGTVLAATCFDDEEDEGNPELQLYVDEQHKWGFRKEHFGYDKAEVDRVIRRTIISLEFEPVPRGLIFSKDSKRIFIAMNSTLKDIKQRQQENDDNNGDDDNDKDDDDDDDDDDNNKKKNKHNNNNEKLPIEPCTLVCVDMVTRQLKKCDRINKLMGDDEYITSLDISPDGVRIALGTNHGRLIVTGVQSIMDVDFEEDEDDNPVIGKLWITRQGTDNEPDYPPSNDDNYTDGAITSLTWSEDCEWLITGYGSGVIKLWHRNQEEQRMSINVNKTLSKWMKRAKVTRKSKLFTCKWELEGLHLETINNISIRGSLMTSASDDGTIVFHDLMETFVSTQKNSSDDAPITIAKLKDLHRGRMVNSISLSPNYEKSDLLIPSAGLFLISCGADNVVHCLSVLEILRDALRKKKKKKDQKRN